MGMKLMGFKPTRSLKVYHNIKHSYFVYPDEKKVIGSSQATDALVKEMIKRDKVAIVRFIPRDNSVVRFCALVPQDEKTDEDGFQVPPGFQLIFLPYADDVKDLEPILEAAGMDDQAVNVDDLSRKEVDSAKLMVKNLAIKFDSRNFENPSLQKFYSGLQALALNEKEPQFEDHLLPDLEGMQKFKGII